jgi:hypothetical protein
MEKIELRSDLPYFLATLLVSNGAWLITPLVDGVIVCVCERIRNSHGLCPACGRPSWCET